MIVYYAYFTDEHGTRMASSFGWTESARLAELYIKTHRLSADEACKPHIDRCRIKKDDYDSAFDHLRRMRFYPYTPDMDPDTQIQMIVVEEENETWTKKELVVVSTNDTLYYSVGRRVTTDPNIYNPRFDSAEPDIFSTEMDCATDACKVVHWLATGGIIHDDKIAKQLEAASIRIAKTNLIDYKEFNSLKYCIITGYLNPL